MPFSYNRSVHWSARYLPSPLLKASALLHVGAAAVALAPGGWPLALGAIIGDHMLLIASGLWPRSTVLGPNWTRLPHAAAARRQVAITIDDGPDPDVTPAVLEILERHGARATFFCIGERIARHAALARAMVRAGHSIENHTQHHRRDFCMRGWGVLRREIELAQACITHVTGSAPRFFRAPAGLRSALLEPQLARLGLRLASWTRRGFDTVSADPELVLRRLSHNLGAGDILLLHDGAAARTGAGTPVILEVLPRLLERCGAAELRPVTLREALSAAAEPTPAGIGLLANQDPIPTRPRPMR